MHTSQPYLSAGFGRARAERGWGPTSARGLTEYVWADQFAIRAELDAARQRQDAIQGVDDAAIVAEIRAQAEQTRAAMSGAQAAILAALPEGDGPVSREDLVTAPTGVFRSVGSATVSEAA